MLANSLFQSHCFLVLGLWDCLGVVVIFKIERGESSRHCDPIPPIWQPQLTFANLQHNVELQKRFAHSFQCHLQLLSSQLLVPPSGWLVVAKLRCKQEQLEMFNCLCILHSFAWTIMWHKKLDVAHLPSKQLKSSLWRFTTAFISPCQCASLPSLDNNNPICHNDQIREQKVDGDCIEGWLLWAGCEGVRWKISSKWDALTLMKQLILNNERNKNAFETNICCHDQSVWQQNVSQVLHWSNWRTKGGWCLHGRLVVGSCLWGMRWKISSTCDASILMKQLILNNERNTNVVKINICCHDQSVWQQNLSQVPQQAHHMCTTTASPVTCHGDDNQNHRSSWLDWSKQWSW